MIVSLLRKEARGNLKGKWRKALLINFVYYVTIILLELIKSIIAAKTQYGLLANIFNIIILITLSYGLIGSYIKLKRNEKVNFMHFIYYAGRDAEKVWKVIGRLALRMLLYILIIILSGYLMITEIISLINGYGVRLSFFVEIITFIVSCILFSMNILYYSLNNYILYDNNKLKSKEILDESKRLMTNHRWDFMRLSLSFIGWYILGLIFSIGIILAFIFLAKIYHYALIYVSYIPLIFLMPYIYVTTACFYDNLKYNNPESKDNAINGKKNKKRKK